MWASWLRRLARLPPRRVLIVVLGALIVALPLARMVRDRAAGADSTAPGKRTAAELRNLGFALESRAADEGSYPTAASLDAIAPLLEGRYMQSVPRTDGWHHPLRYEAATTTGGEQRYFVGSAGADGRWEHATLAEYAAGPRPAGDDMVYGNGGLVALPRRSP